MTTTSQEFSNVSAIINDVDHESDYGDFGDDAEELEIIDQILAQVASEHLEDASFVVTDIEDYEPPRGIRVPKVLGYESSQRNISTQAQVDIEVLRDHQVESTAAPKSPRKFERQTESVPPESDTRSPLERFRKPPKKALSVTDLVSPAWCELQYFYTLSKHGRKKRTPAMKQGSAVHQALEDEVHTTVPIEVTSKEDSWGLRIWNIIQGLRTLRETGRTREFEVWGTVGGEIVNGIIDEISYECPDPKYEESLNGKKHQEPDLPEMQTSITDYLLSAKQKESGQDIQDSMSMKPPPRKETEKQIYITDVKTRATPTLPTGSSIRPTVLQLHLYHHMLENLAQGNFHLSQLSDRYDLDTESPFSDSLIAQLGSLNEDLFDLNSSQESQNQDINIPSSQDSIDILLHHNSLSSLWTLMLSHFTQTFILPSSSSSNIHNDNENSNDDEAPPSTPQSLSSLPIPSSLPTRLSPLLTAEYISPTYNHSPSLSKTSTRKSLIGHKSFEFSAPFLKSYLEDSLEWWKGERGPKGVELQEAWKCRSCDFRDDCAWIHERDEEAVRKVRERKEMRIIAGVEGQEKEKGKTKGNGRGRSVV